MSLRQVVTDPFYITYNRHVRPESITALVKEVIKDLIRSYDSLVAEHKELRSVPFVDLITGKPFTAYASDEQGLSRQYEELRRLAVSAFPLILQFDHDAQHMGEYLTIDHIFR